MQHINYIRLLTGIICAVALVCIFISQHFDVAALLHVQSKTAAFLVNRTIRFLLNDFFSIGLIYALFGSRQHVVFAFVVQLTGLFLFLLPYFVIKIYLPTYNGPLINFLHRIILNPLLMMLLIPAFYYQRLIKGRNG
jgi:exosortase F-associated protein